jgi:hypothetical protein
MEEERVGVQRRGGGELKSRIEEINQNEFEGMRIQK